MLLLTNTALFMFLCLFIAFRNLKLTVHLLWTTWT